MHKMDLEGHGEKVSSDLAAEEVNSLMAASCPLAVRIDEVQMVKLLNLTKKWEKVGYVLTVSDCVTLAASVAAKLGLEVPDRTGMDNLPINFINALAKKNSTPEQMAKFEKQRAEKKAEIDRLSEKEKRKRDEKARRDKIAAETAIRQAEVARQQAADAATRAAAQGATSPSVPIITRVPPPPQRTVPVVRP
jgi:hypothetical protein